MSLAEFVNPIAVGSGRALRRQKARGPAATQTLVVVGNGMVSHRFCATLDAGGALPYRVMVIGEEPIAAYDRVHLTDFLAGKDPQSLMLAPATWYEQQGFGLQLGESVTSIDRIRKELQTSAGRTIPYDKLVLATGSVPFVPPIPGADLPGVFVYRTLADLEKIRQFAHGRRRAAVIGGGLLGLEAARALTDLGLEVDVVETAIGLMARQLPTPASEVLLQQIERLGIRCHVGRTTRSITAEIDQSAMQGPSLRLHLSEGSGISADLIVVAAGVRPRDELARQAGLDIGLRGGVVVNDGLASSDPNIYAIGECASHRGVVYGLVQPGYEMADVLADHIRGGKRRFGGGDMSARLKLLGVDVAAIGQYEAEGAGVFYRDFKAGGVFRRLIFRERRLVGAVGVGPWPELGTVQFAIGRQQRFRERRIDDFPETGTLWDGSAPSVQSWPDAAIVCTCTSTTRGTLSLAIAGGCRTVDALACQTRASTVCGSCKPLLAQLVGLPTPAGAPVKGSRGLLLAGILATIAVALWLLLPRIPAADSVQTRLFEIQQLWSTPAYKQISGFTVVGLSAIALLLSLRKRLSWLSFGSYGFWRMAHGVLGLTTLIVLVCHTGLRLGQNLNLWLMLTFLGLNLLGAFAGVVAAIESRSPGGARRARAWRPWLTRLHIALFWPLPALLTIHILKAYYFANF